MLPSVKICRKLKLIKIQKQTTIYSDIKTSKHTTAHIDTKKSTQTDANYTKIQSFAFNNKVFTYG